MNIRNSKETLNIVPVYPKPIHPVEEHFATITRYHYYIFTLLFLNIIPVFWHFVSLIFLSPPMNYRCEDKGKDLGKNYCPCDDPKWDRSEFTETIQTKFQLICEKKKLISMCHSVLYFGALVGSFTVGAMADKYGRLKMLCICVFCVAFFGLLVSAMPTIVTFIFMRFLEGYGVGGLIVTGYVLLVEYCGVKQREFVTPIYHVNFNVGHMVLPGISYLLRNFIHFQIAVSLPVFLFVFLYCSVYESPKWLMDSGQIDKAAAIMTKIAKYNRTSFGDIKAKMEAYQVAHMGITEERAKFWDLFKHRRLVICFTCMAVNFFSCGMGFYGVSQFIGQMSGNIHKNVFISGAMLIPATLSATAFLYYLNRRTFLMSTSLASGTILLVLVLIIPDDLTVFRVILACSANCFYFMSFITAFLFGVELFPTSIRNSVLGCLAVMSRLGQILAPMINQLPEKLPGCIFGGIAIVGGILCIPLPETKNKELPSSLEAFGTSAAAAPGGKTVNIQL